METKRGGKRPGAGRKPIAEKKKPVTLYFKGKTILKFGSEEKLKEGLYDFAEMYQEGTPQNYDGKKINSQRMEAGQFEESQRTNYFEPISNPAPLTKLQSYIQQIKDCNNYEQVKRIMMIIKNDQSIIGRDRITLDTVATSVIEEKGIEQY